MSKYNTKSALRYYGRKIAKNLEAGNKAKAWKDLRRLVNLYYKERDTDPTIENSYLSAVNEIYEALHPKSALEIAMEKWKEAEEEVLEGYVLRARTYGGYDSYKDPSYFRRKKLFSEVK